MAKQWYVGIVGSSGGQGPFEAEPFGYSGKPTPKEFPMYSQAIGPFTSLVSAKRYIRDRKWKLRKWTPKAYPSAERNPIGPSDFAVLAAASAIGNVTAKKLMGNNPAPKATEPLRVAVWEERDRLSVAVYDAKDRLVAIWWDEEAREMFDQGFFKPGRALEDSVLAYVRGMGLRPRRQDVASKRPRPLKGLPSDNEIRKIIRAGAKKHPGGKWHFHRKTRDGETWTDFGGTHWDIESLVELGLHRVKGQGIGRIRGNPPRGAVEIYDDILEIRAKKGKRSLWPGQHFKHRFTKRGSKIYGLPDGSLLVKGKKRLWKNFDYPEG